MKTLHFQIHIKATKEKVWNSLWSDEGYRYWTSVFTPGSYAKSDWKKGGKVLFLSPEGEGMFSCIEEMMVAEKMYFVHQGEIKDGKEEIRDWAGARENYDLNEQVGITTLSVLLDTTEETKDYFEVEYPKALAKLKEFSEQRE